MFMILFLNENRIFFHLSSWTLLLHRPKAIALRAEHPDSFMSHTLDIERLL